MNMEIIKNRILNTNPLNIRRKKKLRERLTNKNITIIASNCIGGIIYSDLGLRFNSPTINLMIRSDDFIKMCLNLDYYMGKDLSFFPGNTESFPIAKLDDIRINFTHFTSEIEAKQKWEERKTRIDRDNMFIIANDRDGVTEDDIETLRQIKCRGIVVFSSKKNDIPYCLYIDKFEGEPCVGNILRQNKITGARIYEHYFDYVSFFNNSNGEYDLSPYLFKRAKIDSEQRAH